jgi:hypothetical protein
MSLDGNIPYGSVNPFGKPQPQAMTFGDLYNQSTGYYGTPFTGQMPNAGSQGQSFNQTQQTQQQVIPQTPPTDQSGNPMGAVSSAMNPLQTVLGGIQVVGGVMGLKQLQKEAYPSFKPITQLQQAKIRSGQFAQMGYTPEQTAVFRQDLARIGNEDYRNALSLSGGGSLSRALNARRNTMRFSALNQFAQGDAAQRLSNIRYDDSITGQLQNLANMETQNRLQRRISLEQAYGGAIKAGTENIVNSYDSGQALKMISGGM